MAFLPPLSLILAMAAMIALAVVTGVLIQRLLRRRREWVALLVAAGAAGLLIAHAVWLNGNPILVRIIPVADAIVWTNLSPFFVAVMIAAAWRSMAVRWQRRLMVTVLSGVCVLQAYGPMFGRVPPTRPPRVSGVVHRQSTLSTCSAAAAATLLTAIHIDTTEQEMAELCLTRDSGTSQLGLYRGLRIKTPGMVVEIFNGDMEAVARSRAPVIASLGLGTSRWPERRLGHSIVILGRDAEGRYDIADPFTGARYPMREDEFRRLWTGEAMRVVK